MPTIAKFVDGLQLNKQDKQALIQHVRECHKSAGGPSLDDRCTERVRTYLKHHPAPDLSWAGGITLEEQLDAGFTSKQAYKMGIPAIGIVAVLVANVAFIAWSTPPGGSDPYWAGCNYPIFTAFLIVNGIAFMLSVASAIVITAFPLLLNRTPHQAAFWGGTLLLGSLIAFIVAFLLAGFVTVNYHAPLPGCASLSCDDGGIDCPVSDGSGYAAGAYLLNADLTRLNYIASNGSGAVCLRYNASIATNASVTTLVPYFVTCPGTNDDSEDAAYLDCPDVRQLLESGRVQQEVVCMNADNFPNQLPTADLDSYTIPIDPSLLTGYASLAQWYDADDHNVITDLITDDTLQQGLFAYAYFTYSCYSRGNDTAKPFNPLCNMNELLAVTKAGTYMTQATASVTGAVVFGADDTARQNAHAVEALAGFFGFVLLAIVVYLIKAKLAY